MPTSPTQLGDDVRTRQDSMVDREARAPGAVVQQLWTHPLGRVLARDGRMCTIVDVAPGSERRAIDRESLREIAALRGTTILPLIDMRPFAGGRVVAETELHEAVPLHTRLLEGPLEVARAVGILRQIARALGDAHAAGITHGALCASSVLIGQGDPRRDSVRVADFGIGALHWTDAPRDASWSPMSPERILGFPRGPAEDAYLFGCVAFAVLSGTPVFSDASIEALRRRHAIEDAPTLRRTTAGTKIPRALRHFVARCLMKDPDDRFIDGRELEAALCEAQIAASIVTPWDDLPPPDVEPRRAAAIKAGLEQLWQREGGEERPTLRRMPAVPTARREPSPRRRSDRDTPARPPPVPRHRAAAAAKGRPRQEPAKAASMHAAAEAKPIAAADVAIVEPDGRERPAALASAPSPAIAESTRSGATPSPRSRRGIVVVGSLALVAAVAWGLWMIAGMQPRAQPPAIEHAEASITYDDDARPEIVTPAPDASPPTSDPPPPVIIDDPPSGAPSDAPSDDPSAEDPPSSETRQPHARSGDRASRASSRPRSSGARASVQEPARDDLVADAKAAFNRGDYRGAARGFGRAVEASPRDAELRIRLGDAHFKLGELDKAEHQFKKARDLGHAAAARRLERVQAERSR